MNAEAVRAWLTARLDEDEQQANEEDPGGMCDGGVHLSRDRALREIAAKRRRLERHTLGGFTNVTQRPFCGWCTEGYDRRTSEPDASVLIVPWPCPDIIDDAQCWADRDDFPAELRLP